MNMLEKYGRKYRIHINHSLSNLVRGIVVVDGIYCGKRRENRGYNRKR